MDTVFDEKISFSPNTHTPLRFEGYVAGNGFVPATDPIAELA